MNSDEFEWDDGKAEQNLRKHKIGSMQQAAYSTIRWC
jgi:uncharacterized DUF497 family protein